MPFKNHYYPNKNVLFTVFYGVLNSDDMRSYAVEMYNQKKLSEGFSRITDGTLVKDVSELPVSNVSSTVSMKARSEAIQSNGGVIISTSEELDRLAVLFQNQAQLNGDIILIKRTLDEAVDHYQLEEHMHNKFKTIISNLTRYFA